MSEDQHTRQDPTQQYRRPEEQQATKIPHPGLTEQMPERPDHGEESYRGSGRLEGRKAIITGGDSGIGRAVALAFAREGADVLISYLEAEEQDAQGPNCARRRVELLGALHGTGTCDDLDRRGAAQLDTGHAHGPGGGSGRLDHRPPSISSTNPSKAIV